MEAQGWQLFVHPLFQAQLDRLVGRVQKVATRDPRGYAEHPAAKLLATINRLIREIIPRDPNQAAFRQGNTLGPGNRHWFRAKFHGRYRLFFRFSLEQKIIIYVWVNDEAGLGKSGSTTDPYSVFQTMLNAGNPPQSFADLLHASKQSI